MKINRAALKNNAKTRIRSTKPSPILVGLVYLVISYVISVLVMVLDGSYSYAMDSWTQMAYGNFDNIALPTVAPLASFLVFALSLMSLILSAGFTMYCLKICKDMQGGYKDIFDGFTLFFKIIWLEIVMGFFIFLWTLLLFVPGIIASYRYRQALYILIENPELGALECIRRSKAMMMGRKAELFVLDLSFIGWVLLCMFPPVAIWVTPYTSVTYTYYYLALRDLPENRFDSIPNA